MWFGGVVIGDIDELEDERSSSNNTAATREEISTDDVLQD